MARNPMIVVAAVLVAGHFGLAAQAPVPAPPEVVVQAGRYVEAYVEAFSAIVSEEKQTQTLLRADGRVHQTRETTSDFLLVKTGGSWPAAFRDVIVVDGKAVRNREDRLRKLFVEHPRTAPELVHAIVEESGRYNIGIRRVGMSPLLPIIFLTPRIAAGVRFEGTPAALAFQETRRPTVLFRRSGDGSHDQPAHGSFEIEPGTGRVLASEFTAEDEDERLSVAFKVRYEVEPRLQVAVPVEVTERYWKPAKPKDDVLTVRSTYSSFRRFEVTTAEQIKK